ncbi:MAG: DUF2917 domain-containing protein [Casimicrobiaceae bacterium]
MDAIPKDRLFPRPREGGAAWVTQEHDTRDVMLGAGQSFILDRDGTAIVVAPTETEVALDATSDRH